MVRRPSGWRLLFQDRIGTCRFLHAGLSSDPAHGIGGAGVAETRPRRENPVGCKNSQNSGVYRCLPIAIIVALTRRYSSVGRATDL
jgi:hypothetical protein